MRDRFKAEVFTVAANGLGQAVPVVWLSVCRGAMRIELHHGICGGLTYPKFGGFHLCAAAVAPWDIFPASLFGALQIGAWTTCINEAQ